MPNGPDRRSVLRAGAAFCSLSLAGCLGVIDGDSGDSGNETDSDSGQTDGGNVSDDTDGNATDGGENGGDPDWKTIETWPQLQYDAQNTGYVHAEAPTDVEELWSVDLEDPIVGSPVVADGTVYVRTGPGTTYAIEDGDVAWSADTSRHRQTEGTPVLHDDLLVVPIEGGLAGIERDGGDVHWERSLSDHPRRLTLADSVVYLATVSNEMYAVKAASGEERWAQPGGFFGTPAVYDEEVFVLSGGGRDTPPHLRALNIEKGWPRPALQPDVPVNTSVSIRDDTFYLGADDGVYAFDPQSEEQLWHHETDQQVRAMVSVSPDAVLSMTKSPDAIGGELRCADRGSGEERWTAEITPSSRSGPTVLGEQVAGQGPGGSVRGWSLKTGDEAWGIDYDRGGYEKLAYTDGTYYGGTVWGKVFAWG